jgi:hypothetical protein
MKGLVITTQIGDSMAKMIVSTFNSRREADAARQRLREHGFDDTRIRIEGGETAPAHTAERGLTGVIARMFSGILLDDDIVRYSHAVRSGKCVLALHAPDDAAAADATLVLRGLESADAIATLHGPEIYPMPNSPVGWNQATQGEPSTIGISSDPARPDGLVSDAQGLGTADDRERLAGKKAAPRDQDKRDR